MSLTKIVALTGSTGFIGSHILNTLLTNGYQVRALVRRPNKVRISHPNLELIHGDLHNLSALDQLATSTDVVIHCAGRVRGSSLSQFTHDNIDGTRNVLNAVVNNSQVRRLVLISSLAAREPTISNYANSKKSSEQLLEQSHLKQWTIIRPPAVYGSGDTELRPLFDWMRRGILWVPGNANQRFSLLHVSDLCQLIIQQIQSSIETGKILEPDDGNIYSWNDALQISADLFQRQIRFVCIPKLLLSSASHLNVLFSKAFRYSPMLTPGKVRELLHENWVSQCDASISNWTPKVDLKTGLSALYSLGDSN